MKYVFELRHERIPLDGLVVASAGRKLLDVTALKPGIAMLVFPKGCKLDPRFVGLLRDDALILVKPQTKVVVPVPAKGENAPAPPAPVAPAPPPPRVSPAPVPPPPAAP